MFLVDDFIMWIAETMRGYALKEKYSIKMINNMIKENRLLFEIGEILEKEYKQKHKSLLEDVEKAKEIMENLPENIVIKEGVQ